MKKSIFTMAAFAFFGAVIFTSCNDDDDNTTTPIIEDPTPSKPDAVFYGLTSSNTLVKYNANNSATAMETISITGLTPGENLTAIDFRPATGQLYGLSSASQLYIINHTNGTATAIGSPLSTLVTGAVGFDFNPTVDRIRIVSSTGLNFRVNPETGALAFTDAPINPAFPDPALGAAAYTNSVAGATSTSLYAIGTDGSLKLIALPNDGTVSQVGSLNVTGITSDGGFDISGVDNSLALACLNDGDGSTLYSIDLESGASTDLGELSTTIIGLAIPTAPVAYTVDLSNNLQVFNPTNPGTPVSKPITGLQTGETILGIDFRPADGNLYALGSTSRLYRITLSSTPATNAAATQIGLPFTTLTGTNFGFDFNPMADKIRVVSNSGENFRLNPIDGTIAGTDATLNPGSPTITGAAYTNNVAGATATSLFVIDNGTDTLYSQNPPNSGTLISIGTLGLDFTADNGFDIGGTSGIAYALVKSAAGSKIYSISLTTGAATEVGSLPNDVHGFAIGLGF